MPSVAARLKATIEAADRATARGAPGETLRLLLAAERGPLVPDHDHTCPGCGEAWLHLDEPCGEPAAPMPCGRCEDEGARAHTGDVDRNHGSVDYLG